MRGKENKVRYHVSGEEGALAAISGFTLAGGFAAEKLVPGSAAPLILISTGVLIGLEGALRVAYNSGRNSVINQKKKLLRID